MADAFENVLMPAVKTYVESHGVPGGGPSGGGPGAAGRGQGIAKEPERITVGCINPECDAVFDVTTARPGETDTIGQVSTNAQIPYITDFSQFTPL
ncbi:unnamed protein product [marine sediment metagenome]|uniref:Uncharacterized protein n=1 Tax=marine sediment metagenome TaxID=412755 RepID=X1NDL8_9ZZZZ